MICNYTGGLECTRESLRLLSTIKVSVNKGGVCSRCRVILIDFSIDLHQFCLSWYYVSIFFPRSSEKVGWNAIIKFWAFCGQILDFICFSSLIIV